MRPESIGDIGRKTAKNIGKAEIDRTKERVDESTEGFKVQAAQRIEALAEQIRDLGRDLDYGGEAGAIARRLERTADYLRYRPTSRIGSDALELIKENKALWIAAGLLVGMLIYRSTQSRSKPE